MLGKMEVKQGKGIVVVDVGCHPIEMSPAEARDIAEQMRRAADKVEPRRPELMRIHFLHFGQPLCGFSNEVPRDWPPGHCWAGLDDNEAKANPLACQACLAVARKTGR